MHEIGRARDPAPMTLAALRKSIALEIADISWWNSLRPPWASPGLAIHSTG
jgi:hypothetical protein